MLFNDILSVLYVVIALISTFLLVYNKNIKYKYITFILCFWILSEGVLSNNQNLVWSANLFLIDFQPIRILFLFCLVWSVIYKISNKNKTKDNQLQFDKYYLLFVFFILCSMGYHTQNDIFNMVNIINTLTRMLTYIFIYYVVRETVDVGMFNVIIKTVVVLGFFTSIIGVIQYFYDDFFFRLGNTRLAFGTTYRSVAFYDSEYYLSYILSVSFFCALFVINNRYLRQFLVILISTGIFLTFLRNGWALIIIAYLVYLGYVKKKNMTFIFVLILFTLSVLIVASYSFIDIDQMSYSISNSELAQDRVLADTGSSRLEQYLTVIENLPDNFLWGVGSEFKGIYMVSGITSSLNNEVHNMFLRYLFLFGLPCFIVIIIYFYKILSLFKHLFQTKNIIYFLPFIVVFNFIFTNLTIALSFESNISTIMAIFIGLGIGARNKELKLNNIGINEFN